MPIKIKRITARPYRVVSIVRPTLSVDRAMGLVKSLTPNDIKVVNQTISMYSLAYTIDHNKQGHMIISDIEALPKSMWSMRRALEIDENVLRCMFVKNDAKSLSLQLKEENIKAVTPYLTKMGKIVINRTPRAAKDKIRQTIKRLRFLSILPFLEKNL